MNRCCNTRNFTCDECFPTTWRFMISAYGRALMKSDVRCYECSVRRIIRLSVPFSGTAVKHGKLPVSISSIRDEKSKI